jgi:hypothetical protein
MKVRIALALLAAAAVAACGASGADKAQGDACDARARIAAEIEKLDGMSPTTVTSDAVRASLTSIRDDLETLGAARADLGEDRRDALKAANEAFAAEVRDVGANVLRSTSVEDAKTQLTTAIDALAASYRSTLGTYDCG